MSLNVTFPTYIIKLPALTIYVSGTTGQP
uniref:Uncharacterized protein n=1 Tax=Anguilla anguilla TaxID=7936 RepID=A0A0E9TI26_ANGAN